MTTLATAKTITHFSWSPKSGDDTIVFVEDRENIVVQSLSGSKKTVAKGFEPTWLGADRIAFVKDHQIWVVTKDGRDEKLLFDRNAAFDDTRKGSPLGSADGKKLLLIIRDVKREQSHWVPDKAYPVRHFYAIGNPETKELKAINSWAYGGKSMWFQDNERFAHHEYDATGGARLHINKIDGEELATYRGYMPKLSPNGQLVATVSHTFDYVQIIDMNDKDSLPQRIELPKDLAGGRFNNPALWLDDESLILEAKGTILELSLNKNTSALRRANVSIVRRGLPTMAISADRKHVAYETKKGSQSEIIIVPIADWQKETLPEPQEIDNAENEE
jgi:hypothetical protein